MSEIPVAKSDKLRRFHLRLLAAVLALGLGIVALASFLTLEARWDPARCEACERGLSVARWVNPFGDGIETGLAEGQFRSGTGERWRLGLGRDLAWRNLADSMAEPDAGFFLFKVGEKEEGLELLRAAFGSQHPDVAQRAERHLIALASADPTVMRELVNELASPDPRRVLESVNRLGNVGRSDPLVIIALAKVVEHEDAAVARSAMQALRRHAFQGNPQARQVIAANLKSRDPLRQWAALSATANLEGDDEELVSGLVAALESSNPEIIRGSCSALGSLGLSNPAVDSALRRALGSGDPKTAFAAAAALARRGRSDPEVVEILLSATRNADVLSAFFNPPGLLVWLAKKQPHLVPVVVDALRKIGRGAPSTWVAIAMSRLGVRDSQVTNALVAALSTPDGHYAARCLGESGVAEPAVIKALLVAGSDGDFAMRPVAIEALAKLGTGSPAVVQFLTESLRSDPASATVAALALASLGATGPGVVDRLVALLSDPKYGFIAGNALVHSGKVDERVIRALVATLDAPADRGERGTGVASMAASTLSVLDGSARELAVKEGVLEALQARLLHKEPVTRSLIWNALGRLGQGRKDWTDPKVLSFLQHPEWAWRRTAEVVIAHRDSLTPELEAALSILRVDERPWVQMAAWETTLAVVEQRRVRGRGWID